jgi:hypothetical protein
MATARELSERLPGILSVKEAQDLGPKTYTIASSKEEIVGAGERAELKPVLGFEETRKKIVLNKKRLAQLSEIVGYNDEPVGNKIKIDVLPTEVNGRVMDMINILPPDEE